MGIRKKGDLWSLNNEVIRVSFRVLFGIIFGGSRFYF